MAAMPCSIIAPTGPAAACGSRSACQTMVQPPSVSSNSWNEALWWESRSLLAE